MRIDEGRGRAMVRTVARQVVRSARAAARCIGAVEREKETGSRWPAGGLVEIKRPGWFGLPGVDAERRCERELLDGHDGACRFGWRAAR